MNPTIQTVSTIGSERATQGSGNMMVTWSNKTHVAWQDSPGVKAYKNMVRTLDRTTGEWSPAYELNKAKDNHARPVIAVDSRGYLHIVLGGHHSPVTHITSVRPNDTSEWGAPEDVGFGTYPMLVIAADDTLHMTMRNDKGWDGANSFVKPPAGKWTSRHLVKRSYGSGYAAYHNMLALGPNGALHLVCHFYEGDGIMENRGRHQAIAAMKSTDQGKTWTRYDGTPVAVPARVEDMDVIASDMNTNRPASQPMPVPILSMPALAVSSGGVPHVMYVSHLANRGEVMVASPDAKGKWTTRHVDAIEKAYSNWRPVALEPGAFTIADGDVFFALFSLLPLDYPDGWIGNQPTREMTMAEIKGAPVVWLVSRDGGKTFACERAVPKDPESNIAILQIEKATGCNRAPLSGGYPDLFYFEGNADYPKEGEVIQNKVLMLRR